MRGRGKEEAGVGVRQNQEEPGGTVSSAARKTALPALPGRPRSWALSLGVPTHQLKNMQTREFTQKFRHSWGMTGDYFENTQ